MRLLTCIVKGKAIFVGNDLRCNAPRQDGGPRAACNKLVARKNAEGQLAGNFQCERCRQAIEVKLVVPAADSHQ